MGRAKANSRVSAAAGASALLFLAACGGDRGDSRAATDESEEALSATCRTATPRGYDVLTPPLSSLDVSSPRLQCLDVLSDLGTWRATPLFANAPQDVLDRTCHFSWQSAQAATPDLDRLTEDVGAGARMVPNCSRTAPPSAAPTLLYESPDPWRAPMGGAVGCDVCGVLVNGKVYIVRPPVDVVEFTVNLADQSGVTRDYQTLVVHPDALTPSLSVALDAPPPGLHYVDASLRVR